MINIYCAKARAALTSPPELLTAGMAKTVTVRLDFSCDWDGLTKTAVFTDGWRTVDVLESAWENSCVDIPHEVLQTAGRNVRVGVYGCDSNGTALPTIWAELGRVRHGADPAGDESTEPAVPMWGQIQDQIGSLADLSTAAKDNLVAAINEAAKTGSGSDPSTPTTPVDAVLYTEQTLTEEQQEQARANINASSNYARECSHLWFVRDNGEHYRDIVTAARSGGNPVVIRESDWSGTTFIAPAIAVIGDYGSQNSSVPYPITIFSADGTMWFTEIYNLYGKYLTTPRMTELRRIDTAETDVLHVTLTTGDDNVDTSDTTAAAVQEALAAGKVVTVTIGDIANVALLLSAVEGATTGSYDMQLVNTSGVILYTANGTQWTRTFASFGGLATMDDVYAGAVSLGGMSGAAAGQIVKIAEVNDNGTPLAWEPVDMPSGGGAETWELIAEIDFDVDATNDVSVWEYKNLPNYKEIAYRKVGLVGSTETESGLSISINDSIPHYSSIKHAKKGGQSNGWGKILLLPFGWIHINSGSANLPTNYAVGGLQVIFNAIPFDGDSITSVRLSGHSTYKIAGGKLSLYGRR